MEVIILIAALIFIAVFMFGLFCIGDMVKDKKPRNNVRFYIRKTTKGNILSLRNKIGLCVISMDMRFEDFGIDPNDFADMKEGEIREVFINLED